ncbi:MAG: bifunctional 5,10-methylenetetrahydrofolate dehydrogenase/5,10-methenyltetrahydrofolate cyclohydrolase [Verrucomicrobia bacterium]|nr:bifunctional 5,10-methylenetetrahydrofolate dehydrogenase/5,10-methenyltetrahydrofolate cyclohydrolase [Verrucomicrobiota bacterium]MBS0636391.1 bifunctional 5,10-methylenetetrahydrofolate dehydrogenase/5,10-methenyltetrahydrofolate cyclohydrolase [Verrucomicrobiota bacterium]
MILDGKLVASTIHEQLKDAINDLSGRKPCLAAVLTTDHPASHTYVKRKVAACKEVGITSKVIQIAPTTTEEVIQLVDRLNSDPEVDGILLQLPFPHGIDVMQVMERIDPKKDVDGFHPCNIGKILLSDSSAMHPCTPLGIKTLLQFYKIEVARKHVVIVGRSNIVGRPLAALLLQNAPGANATVTVAHSLTENLAEITRTADILVAAVGSPDLIRANMVKEGAVVVDVGINRKDDSNSPKGFKIVGDVAYDEVAPLTSAITPVPGGVGPMTIAMLLSNTLKAYKLKFASG